MATEEKESVFEFNRKLSESNKEEKLEMEPVSIHITVTVECIENLDSCKVHEILLKMEYMNEVIAESEKIEVKSSKVDINLSGYIISEDIDPTFMDNLLSNPVLFLVQDLSSYKPNIPLQPTVSQEKNSKVRVTRSKFGIESKTRANVKAYVGICNLDLGGFLNGNKNVKETLFLEYEKNVSADESVSWVKLPRLKVVASLRDGEEFKLGNLENLHNILGVTVESIYHISSNLSELSNFEARIPFPTSTNKNSLSFSSGKVISVKDLNPKKKWANLPFVDGPGGKTKYSVTDEEVISPNNLRPVLKKIMNLNQKRIEWKMLKRCALSKNDNDILYSKMMKYRVWPVEIFCESNKTVVGKTPKGNPQDSKKSKVVLNVSPQVHFIAFINISSLLYPGVRKARVASPLYTFSHSEVKKKLGADFFPPILEPPVPEPTNNTTNKMKTAGDKSKNPEIETEEKSPDVATPLLHEDGFPVFIIVEFELSKPFIARRSLESMEEKLQTYVSLKEKIIPKPMSYETTKRNYTSAIQDVIAVMNGEYEIFMKNLDPSTIGENFVDNLSNFYDFLQTRENFTRIVTTLEDKMLTFVNAKFGKLCENGENLPEIYVALVEEMHRITNNNILPSLNFDNYYANISDFQFYAEEAIEESEFHLAKDYLLLKITGNNTNPNYWLDYALFCFRMNEFDKALEASKEALSLDMHHQMGLLIFGVISASMKNLAAAELAFQVLLTKYPDFAEAWSILQLLYLSNGNSEASDMAMLTSLKLDYERKKNEEKTPQICVQDFSLTQFNYDEYMALQKMDVEERYGVTSFNQGLSWSDSLSWTTLFCPKSNLIFRVTILLLKLGFLEYAAMALTKDLLMPEGSLYNPCYQYYLAVISYLQGSYKNAICHLEIVIRDYVQNCFLWSLMGHCYYKMNDYANAIRCYEFVLDSLNRPEDIHLVYMRMGNYYLKAKKFYCAKKIFTRACKHSPSPRVWKGVGIACLRLGEISEAELALSEANYLDNRDAETWGYLALVNGLLGRREILRYCYLESKKKNLKNENLMDEILLMISSNFGNYW